MKLELGWRTQPTPGFVHYDKHRHAPHVDVAHDLDVAPGPWLDRLCETILGLEWVEMLPTGVANAQNGFGAVDLTASR